MTSQPTGTPFKIGAPFYREEALEDFSQRYTHYGEIYKQAAALPPGSYLPVEFLEPRLARNFCSSTIQRQSELTCHRRGKMVYISKKEAQ